MTKMQAAIDDLLDNIMWAIPIRPVQWAWRSWFSLLEHSVRGAKNPQKKVDLENCQTLSFVAPSGQMKSSVEGRTHFYLPRAPGYLATALFIMYTLVPYGATEDCCFITGSRDYVVYDSYQLNVSKLINSHQFENCTSRSNILEMNESIIFDLKSENGFTLYGLSKSEEDSWIHDINSNSSQKVHHFSVFSKADETTIFHNCEKVSVHRFSTDRVFTPVNASAHKWDPVQAFTLNENRELRIKLKPSKMIKFSFYISSEGNCKVKIFPNKEERSPHQFIDSSNLSAEEKDIKDKGYVIWKKIQGLFRNVDGEVLIITNEDPKRKCIITNIELRNEMDNYITAHDVEIASIFNTTTQYSEMKAKTSFTTDIPDRDSNMDPEAKSNNNSSLALGSNETLMIAVVIWFLLPFWR